MKVADAPKKINVGYVVTGDPQFTTAFDVPMSERFTTYPQVVIADELKKAGIKTDLRQIHCASNLTLSTTAHVDTLLELAKKQRADLIGIYTHSRRGVPRLFMGSFAETAIHRSPVSLLVLNPQAKTPSRIRSIVYASDFSPGSASELIEVLKICRKVKAKLTVVHHAQIIYKWSSKDNLEIRKYQENTKKMERWIEETCRKMKVPCSLRVNARFGMTSEFVLKIAGSAKADLIVVSAKAGRFAALMGGSITRQILRNGRFPVLVLKGKMRS